MLAAIELAGFFAAHAVWSVCDGETLIPILAFQRADGKQEFRRMEGDQLEDAVASGKDWVVRNPEQVTFAVLIYDTLITLDTGKTDALMLEVRTFHPQELAVDLALPYRHANNEHGFAVHKPKFLAADGFEADFEGLAQAFFTGVAQHAEGSAVWNDHLDETV